MISKPLQSSLPRGVWVLGFVSLLMDTSSEMIHVILPLFLTSVLGLPVVDVGFIEGLADATMQVTKGFSGALSDRLGKRKLLAVLGYGLAAASKPIFPLATGLGSILFARLIDRFGKGIRGAPRDALIADIVSEDTRGASFGLRQALDSLGAVLGPLGAVALMAITSDNFRITMWVAVIPAVLCVVLLVKGVQDQPAAKRGDGRGHPFHFKEWFELGRPFWILVALGVALCTPDFNEAFLLLRASNVGVAPEFVPVVFVVMNVVYALVSFPAGRLSDRIGRKALLAIGFGILAVSHLVLAAAASPLVVFAGSAVWGLHLGLTQGVLSAMVADVAPARLRGTGFGVFSMAIGLAAFAGSLGAGFLWDAISPAAPFWIAAGVTVAALAAFLTIPMRETGRG